MDWGSRIADRRLAWGRSQPSAARCLIDASGSAWFVHRRFGYHRVRTTTLQVSPGTPGPVAALVGLVLASFLGRFGLTHPGIGCHRVRPPPLRVSADTLVAASVERGTPAAVSGIAGALAAASGITGCAERRFRSRRVQAAPRRASWSAFWPRFWAVLGAPRRASGLAGYARPRFRFCRVSTSPPRSNGSTPAPHRVRQIRQPPPQGPPGALAAASGVAGYARRRFRFQRVRAAPRRASWSAFWPRFWAVLGAPRRASGITGFARPRFRFCRVSTLPPRSNGSTPAPHRVRQIRQPPPQGPPGSLTAASIGPDALAAASGFAGYAERRFRFRRVQAAQRRASWDSFWLRFCLVLTAPSQASGVIGFARRRFGCQRVRSSTPRGRLVLSPPHRVSPGSRNDASGVSGYARPSGGPRGTRFSLVFASFWAHQLRHRVSSGSAAPASGFAGYAHRRLRAVWFARRRIRSHRVRTPTLRVSPGRPGPVAVLVGLVLPSFLGRFGRTNLGTGCHRVRPPPLQVSPGIHVAASGPPGALTAASGFAGYTRRRFRFHRVGPAPLRFSSASFYPRFWPVLGATRRATGVTGFARRRFGDQRVRSSTPQGRLVLSPPLRGTPAAVSGYASRRLGAAWCAHRRFGCRRVRTTTLRRSPGRPGPVAALVGLVFVAF